MTIHMFVILYLLLYYLINDLVHLAKSCHHLQRDQESAIIPTV